ncbi:Cytochrome P450 [Micromonospora pattaloongensis]|uniref:Cytochrome P450 n=1 Tax=Micromonospora pattaloongensis TaxID=405436 RepID=A0A1H3PB30_9ACTN|nr:cytochrome P450 [Micromonospora pattaloongensis]SDY98336.1 Cytochrome P450 [Micromonospora pattaloongensis]
MTDAQSRCPVAAFDDTFFADPYRAYALMHQAGPVHSIVTPEGVPAWLVTGYPETRAALADRRLARNIKHAGSAYRAMPLPAEFRSRTLATEDAPEHTRLREFMNRALAFKRVKGLRPRVEQITEQLIDAVVDKGEADLVTALAAPLPITIIGDLLGVPDEHRANFVHWSDAMLATIPVADASGRDLAEVAHEASGSMLRFLVRMVAEKRADPGDDVFSQWILARDDQGQSLDDHELIGLGFMVLLGGYDTTVGMIGGSILSLLEHPERMAELRAHPERLPAAVEEFLRYYGTAHTGVRRFATEDMEIGGVQIAAGDVVIVAMGAADRDPQRFPEPDELDFSRPENHHLAFGQGPHYCPGSELARMEMTVALRAVLDRLPNLRLAVPAEQLPWRRSYLIRILQSLPVTF